MQFEYLRAGTSVHNYFEVVHYTRTEQQAEAESPLIALPSWRPWTRHKQNINISSFLSYPTRVHHVRPNMSETTRRQNTCTTYHRYFTSDGGIGAFSLHEPRGHEDRLPFRTCIMRAVREGVRVRAEAPNAVIHGSIHQNRYVQQYAVSKGLEYTGMSDLAPPSRQPEIKLAARQHDAWAVFCFSVAS